MKPQLIVALDVPSSEPLQRIMDALPREVIWCKVGLELFTSEGPEVLRYLRKQNRKIFLDLKLHDIPNTVAGAVTSAARHEVDMLTLHAGGGRKMLKSAVEAARKFGESAPKLIAVTTLTSLGQSDLQELGVTRSLTDHTLALGEMAMSAGVDGIVCSPHEAAAFRSKLGTRAILITPGIRPAGSDVHDQKRIATAEVAIKAGADFLVVGRPITQSQDIGKAALQILKEIGTALTC